MCGAAGVIGAANRYRPAMPCGHEIARPSPLCWLCALVADTSIDARAVVGTARRLESEQAGL